MHAVIRFNYVIRLKVWYNESIMSKVYICTAIPYVNGSPHIGHAMDYLLSDAHARYCRMRGDEVRLQVGTDEHGNKVFSSAKKNDMTVEAYAQQNSDKFRSFIEKLDISYTDFIRTTDLDHVRRCQEIWRQLKPHIYSAEYDGWYCEGCERFVTQKEYDENSGCCPDHQKPYQKLTEKNYYLRISDFKEHIRTAIEKNEMRILPEFRKQEMLRLLDDAPDISISRPRGQLSWGVPVPDDDDQVMYVWVDALSNYITVLGYPDQDISDYWPAEAQFIGKDILRFHAITWPAILLGVGLPLPKHLVTHGYILADGQKMSKSVGNVVDPIEVLNKHGLDAFRYYFLRHVDAFADADFTWEKFENSYNNELANDLGNLVQRLATLCRKNQISGLSYKGSLDPEYCKLMDEFESTKAFSFVWQRVQDLNKQIDEQKPWELAKAGDTIKLEQVLSNLIQGLLNVSLHLSPFLPDTAKKISDIFTNQEILPPATPLFPKS